MGPRLTRIVSRRAARQIRYVTPVEPAAADPTVAAVYAQLERDFGLLAPPIVLHSPVPELLAGSWISLRESLLASGSLSRAAKEAVATVVSRANTCPYCVDVHAGALHGLIADQDATAIREGAPTAVQEANVRELASWAEAGLAAPDPGGRGRAGLSPEATAEAVGVAVTFHYLNRMVNVFLVDGMLPSALPEPARAGTLRVLGRVLRRSVNRPVVPGGSADLLPEAELPPDLAWAGGRGTVAQALARSAAAFERAEIRSVPTAVRELLRTRLASWDGRAPGLSRQWVSEAVADLPADDRPAGRLALLTALASFQVTGADVDDFRRHRPDDAALIDLTAWAAFSAARRTGAWLV